MYNIQCPLSQILNCAGRYVLRTEAGSRWNSAGPQVGFLPDQLCGLWPAGAPPL